MQLTSDAHGAYLRAVEGAFGHEIDYGQLQKLYGEASESEKRYSPATCIGCRRQELIGDPDPKHISTSFVERHNLSVRMTNRALHSADKRLQQENREPLGCGCARLLRIQLHQDPSQFGRHSRHGRWRNGSILGSLRFGSVDRS